MFVFHEKRIKIPIDIKYLLAEKEIVLKLETFLKENEFSEQQIEQIFDIVRRNPKKLDEIIEIVNPDMYYYMLKIVENVIQNEKLLSFLKENGVFRRSVNVVESIIRAYNSGLSSENLRRLLRFDEAVVINCFRYMIVNNVPEDILNYIEKKIFEGDHPYSILRNSLTITYCIRRNASQELISYLLKNITYYYDNQLRYFARRALFPLDFEELRTVIENNEFDVFMKKSEEMCLRKISEHIDINSLSKEKKEIVETCIWKGFSMEHIIQLLNENLPYEETLERIQELDEKYYIIPFIWSV